MSVFSTDAGRRVLSRIAAICDPTPVGPGQASDLGLMSFMAGMRWVLHQINLSLAGRGARPVSNQGEDA